LILENSFFIRGIIIGFLISIPVGPVGILCIRRALYNGFLSGFVSGLGASIADGLYSTLAVFSLTFVSAAIIRYHFWFRLIGGLFLVYIGYTIFFASPNIDGAMKKRRRSLITDYISAFFLTLANPVTMFAFAAFFAGFGVGVDEAGYLMSSILVLGVMTGSLLWWLLLTGIAGLLSSHFNPHSLRLLNKISGAAIALFGIVALLSLLK
jgi:threonine/homoserine/homoserine lactone efflux protein